MTPAELHLSRLVSCPTPWGHRNNLTYTITPGAGYKILIVGVDGTSEGVITTYNFTNVTANHTIRAYFVTIP